MLENVNALELNDTELTGPNGAWWGSDFCDWCCEHKREIIGGAVTALGIGLACTGIGLLGTAAIVSLAVTDTVCGAAIVAGTVLTPVGVVVACSGKEQEEKA